MNKRPTSPGCRRGLGRAQAGAGGRPGCGRAPVPHGCEDAAHVGARLRQHGVQHERGLARAPRAGDQLRLPAPQRRQRVHRLPGHTAFSDLGFQGF